MKIAVVQFKASTNKEKNLKKIISYIKNAAAKNAKLCAFPEFMMFYTKSSQTAKELVNLSETIKGNFVSSISKAAKENHIQVVGSFYDFMKNLKKTIVFMILRL
jgi:predicted amidohydrolase